MPNPSKLFRSKVLAYEGLIDEDCDQEIIREHHIDAAGFGVTLKQRKWCHRSDLVEYWRGTACGNVGFETLVRVCVGAHSHTRLKSHLDSETVWIHLDSETDNKTQTQMLRLFLCHTFSFLCAFSRLPSYTWWHHKLLWFLYKALL